MGLTVADLDTSIEAVKKELDLAVVASTTIGPGQLRSDAKAKVESLEIDLNALSRIRNGLQFSVALKIDGFG